MKNTIPLWRRFLLVFLSLALCTLLFHGSVALALITRGDEFLQKGRLEHARIYYKRALFFDGNSALAADRYAFCGLELRTPQAIRSSIRTASDAIARNPDNAELLEDRGLLYQIEHRYREARTDFTRAAAITKDVRWQHFAARDASKSALTKARISW